MDEAVHHVVTSGSSHIDIDALACVVAFQDFMAKQGLPCEVVLTPEPNATVPPMIRGLSMVWTAGCAWNRPDGVCRYYVMDVSNPAFFDLVVRLEDVVCVYDHHHGFELYWAARQGVRSLIEPVGACATLVWEDICRAGYGDALDGVSYKLLLTAIVSNSLDFRSQISCARDEVAYRALVEKAGVGDAWKEDYFRDVSASILADPVGALRRDCKSMSLGGRRFWVGQIEVWDASALMDSSDRSDMLRLLAQEGPGVANIISISEGVNYLLADSAETLACLGHSLPGAVLAPCVYRTETLWLRKEIARLMNSGSRATSPRA